MNKERLNKLADYLDTIPNKAFDMRSWVQFPDTSKEDISQQAVSTARRNNFECGMTACLGGHAAILFPRLLKIDRGNVVYKNDELEGTEAFAITFDICLYHAKNLTKYNASHRTPKKAAKAIRDLIKKSPECKYSTLMREYFCT